MSLRMKRFLAGLISAAAAALIAPMPGTSPGLAAGCQRTVAIQPEVSAGEGANRLTFEVDWYGCAASGSVRYLVEAGSAQVDDDFALPDGQLEWQAGEVGSRRITALVVPDRLREADLEDFTVRLIDASPGLRVDGATGHGRILDDDQPGRTWGLDDLACWMGESACPGYSCDVAFDHIICPPPLHANQLTAKPATARWSTIDGTAVAGVDFVGVTDEVVRVPAGVTRVDLPLRLLPRPAGTPSRWFQIRVFAPSEGRVVDGTAVIRLDPTAPEVAAR